VSETQVGPLPFKTAAKADAIKVYWVHLL